MPSNKSQNFEIIIGHLCRNNSGKKHHWILKIVGESHIRTEIFT